MGCRKTQRSGSVTILRHRVITHTHRLDTHGQPTTAVPGVLLVCTTKTPSICWLSGLHLLACSPRSRARCLPTASLKSLHLRRPKPGLPAPALTAARVQFFSPIFGRVSISQPLTSPLSARLLLQPYQLRLSFHYTLIPAHVPAFPSSQPCAAYRRFG